MKVNRVRPNNETSLALMSIHARDKNIEKVEGTIFLPVCFMITFLMALENNSKGISLISNLDQKQLLFKAWIGWIPYFVIFHFLDAQQTGVAEFS